MIYVEGDLKVHKCFVLGLLIFKQHKKEITTQLVEGWFGSSIVFQDDAMVMLLYCIGESVYWLEKGNSMARDGERLTTRDDEGLH